MGDHHDIAGSAAPISLAPIPFEFILANSTDTESETYPGCF